MPSIILDLLLSENVGFGVLGIRICQYPFSLFRLRIVNCIFPVFGAPASGERWTLKEWLLMFHVSVVGIRLLNFMPEDVSQSSLSVPYEQLHPRRCRIEK